jgi:O-antigen/teichoic acid export membrane protein
MSRRGIRTIAGFALNVAIGGLLSLALIPAVISSVGDQGWAAFAVGQSIGVFASVVIAYGWGFHGPSLVAAVRSSAGDVHVEIVESVLLRLLLLPLTVAAGVATCMALTSDSDLAVAGFVSSSVLGLRTGWIFVGLGSPGLMLLLETVPRALATGAAIALLFTVPQVAVFALYLQASGLLISLVLTYLWSRWRSRASPKRPRMGVPTLLRTHVHGLIGQLTSAGWAAAPTLVVASVSPADLPAFALVLRIQAQASTASSPIVDLLQGWVPRAGVTGLVSRVNRAIRVSVLAGSLVAMLLLVFGDWISQILGADTVTTPYMLVALSAFIVGTSLVLQTVNRAGLAALGMSAQFARTTVIGVLCGAATLYPLVLWLGGEGGMWCILLSLAAQLALGMATLRRSRTT